MIKPFMMATMLGMLSLTSCSTTAGRFAALTPDAAKGGPCIDAAIISPKDIPQLHPMQLLAGTSFYAGGQTQTLAVPMIVVPLDDVHARDALTSSAYLSERAARQTCQSYAKYVLDWTADVKRSGATK